MPGALPSVWTWGRKPLASTINQPTSVCLNDSKWESPHLENHEGSWKWEQLRGGNLRLRSVVWSQILWPCPDTAAQRRGREGDGDSLLPGLCLQALKYGFPSRDGEGLTWLSPATPSTTQRARPRLRFHCAAPCSRPGDELLHLAPASTDTRLCAPRTHRVSGATAPLSRVLHASLRGQLSSHLEHV